MLYRLTGDPNFTRTYTVREKEQYFDVPLNFSEAPVFVDGGAYDGETTELFCNYYPNYNSCYLFEPNERSMDLARKRLQNYSNIYFFTYALGDKHELLYFDSEAGAASKIAGKGKTKVEVMPLDDIIDNHVDYIKLDLEGYEGKALVGAKETICNYSPLISVSVYHNIRDFIDIPKTILNYRNDYRLLLRHYTEGLDETVMYFILS